MVDRNIKCCRLTRRAGEAFGARPELGGLPGSCEEWFRLVHVTSDGPGDEGRAAGQVIGIVTAEPARRGWWMANRTISALMPSGTVQGSPMLAKWEPYLPVADIVMAGVIGLTALRV